MLCKYEELKDENAYPVDASRGTNVQRAVLFSAVVSIMAGGVDSICIIFVLAKAY